MESSRQLIKDSTLDSTKTVSSMEKDSTNGPMVEHTQDNMRQIRKRVSEYTLGPMVSSTKGSGAMAFKTASVASQTQRGSRG